MLVIIQKTGEAGTNAIQSSWSQHWRGTESDEGCEKKHHISFFYIFQSYERERDCTVFGINCLPLAVEQLVFLGNSNNTCTTAEELHTMITG